jgi:hypothetical protein
MTRYPVRAGVFSSVDSAVNVVRQLHHSGFTWDEISVICSDEKKEDLFPEQTQKLPTGSLDNEALNVAGAGLLGLGTVAVAAAILSTAGTAVMIIGAFAGIAAAGTFTSLMATRGFESEATDYYEQAVQEGKILVAVEVSGDDSEARRERAAQIISEAGAEVVPLAH